MQSSMQFVHKTELQTSVISLSNFPQVHIFDLHRKGKVHIMNTCTYTCVNHFTTDFLAFLPPHVGHGCTHA
jgi:hypothetical protein